MKIMLYALCNKDTGFGHWFRSIPIQNAVQRRNWEVVFLSDRHDEGQITESIPGRATLEQIDHALAVHNPDWLLCDIPWVPEEALAAVVRAHHARLGYLDAGPNDVVPWCDLLWVQDTPDHIILRDELYQISYQPENYWLVAGGTGDLLGLMPRFAETKLAPAHLVGGREPALNYQQTWVARTTPGEMLGLMQHARWACLALGTTAWECAALGVPMYLFAFTEKQHLTAQKLARYGYAKTWPTTGLPDQTPFQEFLAQEVAPSGPPVAGGAENLLNRLLEQ